MNNRFVLLVLSVAAFTSCNVYKSGQTPDDVYYSPAKEAPAYVSGEENKKKYDDGAVDMNDRYLRMKTVNRTRWSAFDDDYMYWNDSRWNSQVYYNSMATPYYGAHPGLGVGYGMGYGYSSSFYSPWLNPFCPSYYGAPIIIVNPKPAAYRNPIANGPRTFNLNTYTIPSSTRGTYSGSGKRYDAHGRSYDSGSGSNPTRSFSNDRSSSTNSSGSSNSSSRSSSGGSSGSAPVRRF